MQIKFKKLHPEAKLPIKGSPEAACYDVFATEIIQERNYTTVKLGFSTEIPTGYKACVSPRSSFSHKNWIVANSPCQIDSDYRGEWMIKFQAIPTEVYKTRGNYIFTANRFPYEVGDRVAQMWVEKITDFTFEITDEIGDTERGDGGFGSTGR